MRDANRIPTPETSNPKLELESRNPTSSFGHQKLDVFRIGLQMARCSRVLCDRVPRGYRSFSDHLLRAAGQAVLLIGEGANRYTAGQKRQRYTEARGECGEVASAAELLATLRLVPEADAQRLIHLAGRVAAMLTRLIQRHG